MNSAVAEKRKMQCDKCIVLSDSILKVEITLNEIITLQATLKSWCYDSNKEAWEIVNDFNTCKVYSDIIYSYLLGLKKELQDIKCNNKSD